MTDQAMSSTEAATPSGTEQTALEFGHDDGLALLPHRVSSWRWRRAMIVLVLLVTCGVLVSLLFETATPLPPHCTSPATLQPQESFSAEYIRNAVDVYFYDFSVGSVAGIVAGFAATTP